MARRKRPRWGTEESRTLVRARYEREIRRLIENGAVNARISQKREEMCRNISERPHIWHLCPCPRCFNDRYLLEHRRSR